MKKKKTGDQLAVCWPSKECVVVVGRSFVAIRSNSQQLLARLRGAEPIAAFAKTLRQALAGQHPESNTATTTVTVAAGGTPWSIWLGAGKHNVSIATETAGDIADWLEAQADSGRSALYRLEADHSNLTWYRNDSGGLAFNGQQSRGKRFSFSGEVDADTSLRLIAAMEQALQLVDASSAISVSGKDSSGRELECRFTVGSGANSSGLVCGFNCSGELIVVSCSRARLAGFVAAFHRATAAPVQPCNDCNVLPGELHEPGCDIERCPECGGQRLCCSCQTALPPIPWSGEWPGVAECREFGWYSRFDGATSQWIACGPDDPGAGPDLNRLCVEADWDREKQRFTKGG